MDPEFIEFLTKDCVSTNIGPDTKGKILKIFPLRNLIGLEIPRRNSFATCGK